MQNKTLIDEIEQFKAETGLGDYRVGYNAVKNGRLVERLRAGKRVWPETEKLVRDYMRAERKRRKAKA